MKQLLAILSWGMLVATGSADDLTVAWGPRASFQATFRVVDDEGHPVEGAKLGCSWGRLGFKAPDVGQANLMTDQDGRAMVAARSVLNEFNYLSALTLVRSRRPNTSEHTTFKPEGGYFFRVRTELDAQGNVVKAWYGKIYGDFFDMVYYLNPDGTRNVEFDPQRNLFKPAKRDDSAYWNLGP